MRCINPFTRLPGAAAVAVLCCTAFVAGCGSDENVAGPNPTPDTTAPTVLSTNPINGSTGVAVINVTFSEPMASASVSDVSFTLTGPGLTPVAGVVTYDAPNNRASFVPSSALTAATSYKATIMTAVKDRAGNALANNYVWDFVTNLASTIQPPEVLASSGGFAVLAGASITSTGMTRIIGGVGLSPGTSLTGFPPGIIVGTKHVADPAAAQAKLDLTTAYNGSAGRTLSPVSVAGNIGGMTLPPGLYKSTSSLEISSGDLTLDGMGNANAVWVFQIASTLTTTSGRKVILAGGAKASNIFWQVGTSATLGTTSVFKGTIMADQSITMNTGATLEGRVLARTASVTLNGNTIVVPAI